jgi:Spy/CpxP family protein refolding chaperone
MVMGPKLKVYGIVLGIFVLGASAGGAAGFAVANHRLASLLREDKPGMMEARRVEMMSAELDLDRQQRKQIREILERHRDENRKLSRVMVEQCGSELQGLRSRVDEEIRRVLSPEQARRFGELMEKRGHRFPFGRPGPRSR